jgi:hypothetical protein
VSPMAERRSRQTLSGGYLSNGVWAGAVMVTV